MPTFRKIVALLLLAAFLAAPWASAASPPRETSKTARPEPAARALLSRVQAFLSSVWTKIGCGIDPSGLCTTAPAEDPQIQSDIGCGIDPDGQCHS